MNELERLRILVVEMHEADDAYGCGFYNDARWLRAYQATRKLVGLPEEWTHSQLEGKMIAEHG